MAWLPFRTRVVIDVAAEPDSVFEYVANPARWDEWQGVAAATTQTSSGDWGVGSTYEMAYRSLGRNRVMACQLMGYEPPRRFACSCVMGSYVCDAFTILEPTGDGTRVTVETRTGYTSFLLTVPALIAWPVVMWLSRRAVRKQLGVLKRTVEAR